jgi:Smg protein
MESLPAYLADVIKEFVNAIDKIYTKKSAEVHTTKESIYMYEILIYLFENYFDKGGYPDSAVLTHKLTIAGFEEDEINQALNWLSDLTKHDTDHYPATFAQSNSLRWYTPSEMEVIDNEGRGFILFLEQAGILNPLQRELLIDRVLKMNGNNSSLEKIKLVVLLDLWIQNQLTDLNILEKLFIASNPRYRH